MRQSERSRAWVCFTPLNPDGNRFSVIEESKADSVSPIESNEMACERNLALKFVGLSGKFLLTYVTRQI